MNNKIIRYKGIRIFLSFIVSLLGSCFIIPIIYTFCKIIIPAYKESILTGMFITGAGIGIIICLIGLTIAIITRLWISETN